MDDIWFEDGKVYCPGCMDDIRCMPTAYGLRAACHTCNTRWTKIRGESDWTAESLGSDEKPR